MAAQRVLIQFNDLTDVVSAFFDGTKSSIYGPSQEDNHIMLERDATGQIVGVDVLGASDLKTSIWSRHPVRHDIPAEILGELDRWLARRSPA